MLKTVVLPAPFGPIKPINSPFSDLHAEIGNRGETAKPDRAVIQFEQAIHQLTRERLNHFLKAAPSPNSPCGRVSIRTIKRSE